MNLGLTDKVALVLGAGGGLGGATAAKLSLEGAKVVAADIDFGIARKTQAAIEAAGGKAMALKWDLDDFDVIDECVTAIESEFGSVDTLVNNTGGPPPTFVTGQDLALWRKHFRSMVLSIIAITDRVLPQMKMRQWGRIVTSTSSGVVAPILTSAFPMPYDFSWSAGRKRLLATSVTMASRPTSSCRAASLRVASLFAGPLRPPEEYANVVAFLSSEAASFVTGSVIRVDGGMIQSI